MKKKLFLNFVIIVFLFGTSVLSGQGFTPPKNGKSVIYFVRLSNYGTAWSFEFFHQDKCIGIFKGINYMRYECDPGKQLFWASSENRSFITADLEEGGTYIVLVDVITGIVKSNVRLRPITADLDISFGEVKKLIYKKAPVVTPEWKIEEINKRLEIFISENLKKYEDEWKNEENFNVISADMAIPPAELSDTDKEAKGDTKRIAYFGLGFSFGFISPEDVNDYISYDLGNVNVDGSSRMSFNLVGRLSLSFRINKFLDLSLIGEYAWAHKSIVTYSYSFLFISDREKHTYDYSRFSPGLIANIYVPTGSGKHALLFAPGLLYSFMNFEDFKATGLGGRFKMGFSFNNENLKIQPFFCYDWIKAKDEMEYYHDRVADFELDYSGLQIGVDLSF